MYSYTHISPDIRAYLTLVFKIGVKEEFDILIVSFLPLCT